MRRWMLVLAAACGGRDAVVDEPRAIVADAQVDAPLDAAAPPDAAAPADAAPPDAAVVRAPPKPRPPKLDIADVGTPGAAVTLVPVAGKITVFDFWAPWCTPCKDIDRALRALAKRFPNRLAIRRIDIDDMDTPAAVQHLVPGGFGLPHLKVYDAAGGRVLEESSGTSIAALIAKVRALVD